MRDHPGLQAALSSPIPSVRTPFLQDGEIDFDGLRRYVEQCLANGARALMLTFGDSLYTLLTDEEVAQVTRTVVEQTRQRAAVIAADRAWWTGKAVEFARFCKQIGADILMVLPPDWGLSATPETLTRHYAVVAAEIPVMMVTNYLIARGQASGLEIVQRVYREAPGVLAIKDDFGEEFGRRMTAMVEARWTVIAGGSKQLHAYLAPFGSRGYLSTLLVYQPQIAHAYWHAFEAGDYSKMARIVRDIDIPMFDVLSRCPGGFDAGLHAWAELVGLYGRWRRSPYYNLTDAEMESLTESLDKIGLLERQA
jgi:dihydrodipicolinate synthase/N-acetylneuraminate lyase